MSCLELSSSGRACMCACVRAFNKAARMSGVARAVLGSQPEEAATVLLSHLIMRGETGNRVRWSQMIRAVRKRHRGVRLGGAGLH